MNDDVSVTPSSQLAAALVRVALGDQAALKRVYDLTSSHLFGVALRILRRRDLAEEVLQETYISVWHHADSYRVATSQPMTWLITLVRNKALDVVRSAAHRREIQLPVQLEGEEVDLPDDAADAVELLNQATQQLRVRQCMDTLAATHRQCLALAYYQGFTYTEVAARLHAPVGSVKSWARRGLVRLKHCLAAAA
jgi:RNA polymerase sigma-70 factor, ECF subfamily